jgi:hypothetical protein
MLDDIIYDMIRYDIHSRLIYTILPCCDIILHILCYAMLCYTVLYCTVLYCTVLYYTVLYYTVLYYIACTILSSILYTI